MSRTQAKSLRALRPDPEVEPVKAKKRKRRTFTAQYKLKIVREADRCTEPGEVGALLRREGLYSSQLTNWRRARDQGQLAALNRKRGRKPDPDADLRYELEKMRKENERLKKRLDKAETIIDVQKKLCTALGLDPKT